MIYIYWYPTRFPYHMMFMSFNINMTGVTTGAGTANMTSVTTGAGTSNPSEAPEFTSGL
jgi:hypothetical protein